MTQQQYRYWKKHVFRTINFFFLIISDFGSSEESTRFLIKYAPVKTQKYEFNNFINLDMN